MMSHAAYVIAATRLPPRTVAGLILWVSRRPRRRRELQQLEAAGIRPPLAELRRRGQMTNAETPQDERRPSLPLSHGGFRSSIFAVLALIFWSQLNSAGTSRHPLRR